MSFFIVVVTVGPLLSLLAISAQFDDPNFDRKAFVQQYRMKHWPDYLDGSSVMQMKTIKKTTKKPTSPISIQKERPPDPSEHFLACCKTSKLPISCHNRCNFEILDKSVLTGLFLATDPCPRKFGSSLLSCAASGSDHTECCKRKGVNRTGVKDKCLGFCQLGPESGFQADAGLLPCFDVLEEIKSCFKEHIINNIS